MCKAGPNNPYLKSIAEGITGDKGKASKYTENETNQIIIKLLLLLPLG